MKLRLNRRIFLMAGAAITSLAAMAQRRSYAKTAAARVAGLKVDHLEWPLGLENPSPRFSWQLESDERNVRQSAYRIWVASSEEALKAGRGDLWDSGRVSSRNSIGIQYSGSELTSRQRCWWRVQVWDERGVASNISKVGGWEMGLLAPSDWQAQWLAVEDSVARADRQAGLSWIWASSAPDDPSRKFRLKVELPVATLSGRLVVGTPNHLAGVWIDGEPQPIELPRKYAIGPQPLNDIALGTLRQGAHVFAVEVHVKTGPMASSSREMTAFIRLELEDGRTLRIPAGTQWRTSSIETPDWFTAEYDDQAWGRGQILPNSLTQPWPPTAAMHLRKAFVLEKPVAHARLYATALGAYEARLNGNRVGDALLTPESTLYSKRALYRTYDVTDLIRNGANVLGLTVGDGWFGSTIFGVGRYAWGPPPRRVLAQLELTFADGSRQSVHTGPGWRIAQSPITRSEIYNGEEWDARLESSGWDSVGFDDSKWESAETAETPSCRLVAQVSPPIRATQILKAREITEPAPGVYVVDFGQNFAGWCRLRAKGPAGTRIEMRFAELLLPTGEVDQSNLRAARQTDAFILRGNSPEEIFEPKFTYHGFRYVQISGLPAAPIASSLDGIVVHSDLPMTGKLRIDNAQIGQISRNIVWTQRSNFMGIPTDCPQRDERLGYMGDAGIFWDTAAFNMDIAAFTRRHMDNAADTQAADGAYPISAPAVPALMGPNSTPGWSDGGVILPWTAWQRYGDQAVIEQNWEGMSRYLQPIFENNPDGIWRNKRNDIGDWLAVEERHMLDPSTPHDLIATAYWAHSVDLLAQMAGAIGRGDDAASLRTLHERIRQAFAKAFVKADGQVGNESQTSYVLALKYGLVPEELRAKAGERLAADIRRRGGALSTGILGTQFTLDVLADAGHASIAYDLLLRTEYPSWGYMIAHGATTIWEGWNARVWSGPKGETMPNSYNQYALGAIGGFLFRRIAGIDAGAPGFKTILVRPVLDPRIKKAGGDYESIIGRISTDWEQRPDGRFTLDVTVPANATAHIHLPARRGSRIDEGRTEISRRSDMRLVARLDDEAVVEVGSGTYRFVVVAHGS